MFNRSIQMSLVKTPKTNVTPEETKPFMTVEEANAIRKDIMKDLTLAVAGTMVLATVLNVAGRIVIKAAESNIK